MTTPSATQPTRSAASSPSAPSSSPPASSQRRDCGCHSAPSIAVAALANAAALCQQLDLENARLRAENVRLEAAVRAFLAERKKTDASA